MTREEAIRIIEANCSCSESKLREACAMFIPELRDSEDERIIRAIIDALYSHTNSINLLSSRGYQMENIEAWLEKQKYDRMKPVYDNQDSFESALGKAWKDYNDSGARTVDGCEDNYVECAHAKGFREGYLFGLEKQKEQKPAEWSEDDEKMREKLINLLGSSLVPLTYKEFSEYRFWLKSIRPGWKPTEEQMDALAYAIQLLDDGLSPKAAKAGEELEHLREQLKKL